MTKRKTVQYNLEYAVMNGLNWMVFCATFTFAGVFLLGRGYSSTELGLIAMCWPCLSRRCWRTWRTGPGG